jgi:hypothetical protein
MTPLTSTPLKGMSGIGCQTETGPSLSLNSEEHCRIPPRTSPSARTFIHRAADNASIINRLDDAEAVDVSGRGRPGCGVR